MRIVVVTLLLVLLGRPAAAESVRFPGLAADGDLMLGAVLRRPAGPGPFPALVMLHGCSGLRPGYHARARKFVARGFVTLLVDSLGPRGQVSVCGAPYRVGPAHRARDAHAGRAYLARQTYIDRRRIGVIGWSHGGWGVLSALGAAFPPDKYPPFRAAVAYYPPCQVVRLAPLHSRLLILSGGKDDWTPPAGCAAQLASTSKVTLKIYRGAYHAFDWPGLDITLRGHRLLYDPAATADADVRVRAFFNTYMNVR